MRGLPATLRWGACFTLALGLHAAGAAALIARWHDSAELAANAPVIMIDLAPVAAAPQTTPSDKPPAPVESRQQIEPEPTPEAPPENTAALPEPAPEKPAEKVDVKPEPVVKPELAVLPPPKPLLEKKIEKPVEKPVAKNHVRKKPHRVASRAGAPSAADRKASHAAAPMPGASSNNPNALPRWQSALFARLKRYTRYPAEAASGGHRATVYLAFRVDRHGGVHHARIVRSSGSEIFDRATLEMIKRAAPVPAPPPEIPDSKLNIEIPIRYSYR